MNGYVSHLWVNSSNFAFGHMTASEIAQYFDTYAQRIKPLTTGPRRTCPNNRPTHIQEHNYHVYVGRWRARQPESLLGFVAWWGLMQEFEERATVAEMVGETDGRVVELRRVLLVKDAAQA